MCGKIIILCLLAGMVFSSAGCASVLVAGAGGGIAYTVTNIAYKTVSHPYERVEGAVHGALRKMGIREVEKKTTGSGIEITAATSVLTIYIEVEMLTPKSTKLCVDARKSLIFKDKATAAEIIEQALKILEEKGPARTLHL